MEYHDPVESSTTSCPFLPGQQVNVLDVPVQGRSVNGHTRPDSSESFGSAVFTLDPLDKYSRPRPPSSGRDLSAALVDQRGARIPMHDAAPSCISPQSTGGNHSSFETPRTPPPKAKIVLRGRPRSARSPIKQSIVAIFHKTRWSRSAGSFSRQQPEHELHENFMQPVTAINDSHFAAYKNSSSAADMSCRLDANSSISKVSSAKNSAAPAEAELSEPFEDLPRVAAQPGECDSKQLHGDIYRDACNPCDGTPWDHLRTRNSFLEDASANHDSTPSKGAEQPDSALVSGDQFMLNVDHSVDIHVINHDDVQYHPHTYSDSDASSYKSADNFSPGLAPSTLQTDAMSPYHLPQPETPSMSEFGDGVFDFKLMSESELQDAVSNVMESDEISLHRLRLGSPRSVHDAAYSGCHEYSLPPIEHESPTLSKMLTKNSKSSYSELPLEAHANNHSLQSWNQDFQSSATMSEELIEDLGYLGELII